MALMTYGALVGPKSEPGSIRAWVNYNKVDPESCLQDAQSIIFGSMRVREMETVAPIALAIADYTKALPTGYLDPLTFIWKDGTGEVAPQTPQNLLRMRAYDSDETVSDGRPMNYSVFDDLLQFDYAADTAANAVFLFYKQPTYLATGTQTNFLTTRYPHILRSGCRLQASIYMQDEVAIKRDQALFDGLIARANAENDFRHRGVH